MLAYPPAVRVLRLLSPDKHLTKFEIGRQLGFVGEAGFTSMSQPQIIRAIAYATTPKEKADIRSDREGSSDKYARMIAGWLTTLGWVRKATKTVTVTVAGQTYTESLGQSYTLTHSGQLALERSEGNTRHPAISKYVPFEMLATKEGTSQYLRTRRATLLLALQSGNKTAAQLQTHMLSKGFDRSDIPTIQDDIAGFVNIGLRVPQNATGQYQLRDPIHGLAVPAFGVPQTQGSDVDNIKQNVRAKLHHVPHAFLDLIDLSFQGRQNSRIFESRVAEIMVLCGYDGAQLGDSNQPDGAFYTAALPQNYGLIIDAKAYSNGFNCGAHDRDEMGRYIQENLTRPAPHRTTWWAVFPATLSPARDFRFLFVTSRLLPGSTTHFRQLHTTYVNVPGSGISAANLLLFAEAMKDGSLSLADGRDKFAVLREVTI